MNIYAATEKSDIIGPEGMEKFCEDIGVEPENVCYRHFHTFCLFYVYLCFSLYLIAVIIFRTELLWLTDIY